MSPRSRKGPLARLRAYRRIERVARRVGRLDATQALGDLSLGALRAARHAAAVIGGTDVDIVEAVFTGLDKGRLEVATASTSDSSSVAKQGRFPWS